MIGNLILALLFTAASLFAADPAQEPAPTTTDADVKAVVETIESLSGVLKSLDAAANSLGEEAPADANKTEPKVDKQGRPLKNTIAIITAGAAAGASIGAATKKGTQAIVIGAVAGAAAGLIYDRMTADKKAEPAKPAEPTKAPVPAKPAPTPAPAT